MEVATTNNHHNHSHPHHHHNHNHNHHQHHHHQRMPNSNNTTSNNNISNGVMATSDDGGGVVGGGVGGGPRSPFQREVHEWQRIDPDTGAIVSGRLEADRWIAGPLNSYGKISDSQNFTQPNGTQHSQRKQLEVLQAHTTGGGAMQVIRAQTVQTTSSRWSSTSSPLSQPPTNTPAITQTPTSPPTTLTTRAIAPIILPSTTSLSLSSSASSLLSSSSSPPPSPPVTMTNDFSNAHHEQSHYHHISHQQPKWPTASSTQAATQMSVNVGDNERDRHHHHQHHHHYGDDDADHDHDHDYHDDNDNNEHHQSYLINGVSNRLYSGSSNNNSNNSNNNSNLLLLDTEPSLKLSNLMKSSSSISSNNSSSNNSLIAAATATMNTHHKSATGKISLHAIVGNTSNQNNEIKSSSSSATTATSKRQQQQQRSSRLFEQPAIYGKNSNANGWSKSRVGVNNDSNEAATATSTATAAATICGNGAGSFADELRHRQLTPTHSDRQQSQQPRRVFESFRHGFASTLKSSAHTNHHHHNDDNDHDEERDHNNVDDDDDGDDDNLRLTARHQRRQQVPPALIVEQPTSAASLYRSRSISTDDLSTEWDTNGGAAEEEPGEWRRVSKLRRSFQSPGTHDAGGSSSNATAYYNTTSANLLRRPLDLPTNSVSVSKIRAELENGRRLNTAMRSNHVDLAALDTILNASADTKPVPAKRTTFLTAESLKEIRGKLKKLSDESLYKEDFMAHQQLPVTEEHIEVQHHMRKPDASTELRQLRQLRQLTPEESPEITPPKSAFQTVVQRSLSIGQQQLQSAAPTTATRTTNSLESRQKYKDSSSTEWHSRRKSYGFEKMSPPDDRTMFRMDASTDSGLGRSGELGNWSPTESSASAVRGTVIHFGEPPKTVVNTPKIQRRYRLLKSPDEAEEETLKRHSIAVVDESQYVRENLRKTSHVHLNGLYEGGEAAGSQTLQTVQSSASSTTLFQRGQQKRVEFCKTEVHFAAESGRVNIVETDGKPPPTQNFRRRRRTASGPLQSLVKSASTVSSSSTSTTTTNSSVALPITLFGDDKRGKSIASPAAAYNAAPGDAALDEELEPINVTVSMPKLLEAYESSRSSYASTSGIDTTDNETDEFSAIRGILKNKPIKPKPYHLGENIESPDALWGVQLKSINGSINKRENVAKGPSPTAGTSASSVAERIRVVETRQEHTSAATTSSSLTNGYSTKINLSLGDTQKDWMDAGVQDLTERRPSAQELMLQDLREHQRILDEGLKSTSLIIKTMRSASEFDEAMRRLSIASMEAAVIPPVVVPTSMIRSNSYQESTRRYSTTSIESCDNHSLMKSASCTSTSSCSTMSRRYSTDSCTSSTVQPFVAPRLKLLGNTSIPVSQQLSQLRRMYDVNGAQDEDSADEEVKSYFPGHPDNISDSGSGTQESSLLEDMHSIEYSNSWSRLKAKRTVWKIEADECKRDASLETLDRKEVPTSNVMSIELHSPLSSEQPETMAPVAKPRTLAAVHQSQQPKVHTATTVKQYAQPTTELAKEPLKIIKEARGARKLKEHELSYFGVQVNVNNNSNSPKAKLLTLNTNLNASPKRTLPQRKPPLSEDKTIKQSDDIKSQAMKWQLLNDKPDLLRHSPSTVDAPQNTTRPAANLEAMPRKSLHSTPSRRSPVHELSDTDDEDDEHFYENISNELTPVFKVKTSNSVDTNSYDRKTDLKRDAQILSEMTRNADQTLKALTDEAAHKDQRRRSLQRRTAKPLETIDEKTITEKIPHDRCIAVKVSRSTVASEAKRTSRHSTPSPTTVASRTRTSSQSSLEENTCPRARSRSLSSEREYENVKVKRTSTAPAKARLTKPTAHSRSSSRESYRSSHTQCSSGDEVCKREERVRHVRPKRSSSSSTTTRDNRQHDREHERECQQRDDSKSQRHRLSTAEKQQQQRTSSTTRSSQKERTECSTDPRHSSSSSRRRKEEHDSLRSTRSSTTGGRTSSSEKHERSSSGRALVRSTRGHEHADEAHHRSSHRSERTEKDKDKDSVKPVRSKGHASRSTPHSNERSGTLAQQHKATATPTKIRDHRKSSTATTTTTTTTKNNSESHKQQQTQDILTHSKNQQMVNGHDIHYHNNNQNRHNHQQQPHHVHNLTTTTIAAKHRERNGKDRK